MLIASGSKVIQCNKLVTLFIYLYFIFGIIYNASRVSVLSFRKRLNIGSDYKVTVTLFSVMLQ